jgi:hypothetical protein
LQDRLCRIAGRDLTAAERAEHLPDQKRLLLCP